MSFFSVSWIPPFGSVSLRDPPSASQRLQPAHGGREGSGRAGKARQARAIVHLTGHCSALAEAIPRGLFLLCARSLQLSFDARGVYARVIAEPSAPLHELLLSDLRDVRNGLHPKRRKPHDILKACHDRLHGCECEVEGCAAAQGRRVSDNLTSSPWREPDRSENLNLPALVEPSSSSSHLPSRPRSTASWTSSFRCPAAPPTLLDAHGSGPSRHQRPGPSTNRAHLARSDREHCDTPRPAIAQHAALRASPRPSP